jgi:hypothetical protein
VRAYTGYRQVLRYTNMQAYLHTHKHTYILYEHAQIRFEYIHGLAPRGPIYTLYIHIHTDMSFLPKSHVHESICTYIYAHKNTYRGLAPKFSQRPIFIVMYMNLYTLTYMYTQIYTGAWHIRITPKLSQRPNI